MINIARSTTNVLAHDGLPTNRYGAPVCERNLHKTVLTTQHTHNTTMMARTNVEIHA